MSQAAAWSYTHKATHWPLTGRDDWTGAQTFGAPVVFDCDYIGKSVRMTDTKGVEFVTRQVIYTEKGDISQGDRVLLDESVLSDPLKAEAQEVRAVTRYADMDGQADDFEVAT